MQARVPWTTDLYGKDGVKPEDPPNLSIFTDTENIGRNGTSLSSKVAYGFTRLAATYGPGRDRGFTAAMTSHFKL